MKKLITIFLTALLCCTAASAENNAEYYYGTWFSAMELDGDYYAMKMFHLFEDGKCYYSSRINDGDVDPDPLDMMTTWQPVENGVRIQFSAGYREYLLTEDGRLSDGEKSLPTRYKKIFPVPYKAPADAPKVVPGNLEGGFLLDPGQYIIGEDLPAGNYRFEYYNAPVDIFVRKDPEATMWSAFAAVSENSPVYAKLNLPEGGRLDVVAFPVIIMYAKPLAISQP